VIFGVTDPVIKWVVGPLIVFVVISLIFKAIATVVHQKVEVYYKYKAGELRLILWERLNRRVGLCLALLNGTAYLVLISFVIYVPSYLTYQFATSDADPRWMRWLNRLGEDLRTTGFAKVPRSMDSISQNNYDMVDVAALVYRNPLLQARIERYPGFFMLAERPEFKDFGGDKEFRESWLRLDPVMTLWDSTRLQNIRANRELVRLIWDTVSTDRADLLGFFATGKSSKYDPEKIVGRWDFDPNATLNALRRARPNIVPKEMQRIKLYIIANFAKTTLVAMPENATNTAILRELPLMKLSASVTAGGQPLTGDWKSLNGKYQLNLGGAELASKVEGDHLSIKTEGMELIFTRED
jgi:hypothetical protein